MTVVLLGSAALALAGGFAIAWRVVDASMESPREYRERLRSPAQSTPSNRETPADSEVLSQDHKSVK